MKYKMDPIVHVIYTYALYKGGLSRLSCGWKENYGYDGRSLAYRVYDGVCKFLDKYGNIK